MNKTPLQFRIEETVTNGLGYDFKKIFINKTGTLTKRERKYYFQDRIDENNIYQSKYGLNAHLAAMNIRTNLIDVLQEYNTLKEKPFSFIRTLPLRFKFASLVGDFLKSRSKLLTKLILEDNLDRRLPFIFAQYRERA